jgi:hypothetical protein
VAIGDTAVHPPSGRSRSGAPYKPAWPGARRAVLADTSRVRQVLCPVLVGREGETAHLQAGLAAAQAGRGGTVLVTGEAGIGSFRAYRIRAARFLATRSGKCAQIERVLSVTDLLDRPEFDLADKRSARARSMRSGLKSAEGGR